MFFTGFAKAAFEGNLPEQAAEREAAQDFTQVVKGSNLPKETGQSRSGYAQKTRTGESRAYPQGMRHRVNTSRG